MGGGGLFAIFDPEIFVSTPHPMRISDTNYRNSYRIKSDQEISQSLLCPLSCQILVKFPVNLDDTGDYKLLSLLKTCSTIKGIKIWIDFYRSRFPLGRIPLGKVLPISNADKKWDIIDLIYKLYKTYWNYLLLLIFR